MPKDNLVKWLEKIIIKKKPAVGIDIGSHSIKALYIDKSGGNYRVSQYGIVQLPTTTDISRKSEAIVDGLQKLKREMKFPSNAVVTSIAGEPVVVRSFELPSLRGEKEEAVRYAVQAEAQNLIPFTLDEAVWDYERLNLGDKDRETEEILVVAAKREIIETYLSSLVSAGLEPVIIDVASFALCNALCAATPMDQDESVMVINIGAEILTITIVKNGKPLFNRDITANVYANILSGVCNSLNIIEIKADEIIRKFGVVLNEEELTKKRDEEGAESGEEVALLEEVSQAIQDLTAARVGADILEEQKSEFSPIQVQEASSIVKSVMDEIISELRRCLFYYENQMGAGVVGRIFLSGGVSMLPNVDAYFQEQLDMECTRFDPFARMEIASDLPADFLHSSAPIFGVCAGLGLRNVL